MHVMNFIVAFCIEVRISSPVRVFITALFSISLCPITHHHCLPFFLYHPFFFHSFPSHFLSSSSSPSSFSFLPSLITQCESVNRTEEWKTWWENLNGRRGKGYSQLETNCRFLSWLSTESPILQCFMYICSISPNPQLWDIPLIRGHSEKFSA